jgi:hypothetical protein
LGRSFGAPAARTAFEHVTVMQQPIEHCADSGHIAEKFAPVIDWAV